jgi:hypothetical protein
MTIETTRLLWAAHVDTLRGLLPHLDIPALTVVAADLRPGSGGRWEGMPPDLEAQRQLLLAQVAEFAERLGVAWPIEGDLLPEVPDSAEGLE